MAEHPLSIIYNVRLRKSKSNRVVVELVRDHYCKQLAYYAMKEGSFGVFYSSSKPRPFFDREDELNVFKTCRDYFGTFKKAQFIGSVELQVFIKNTWEGEQYIEVCYASGEVFATWGPVKGLRWSAHAHPVFTGDKKHIAKVCYELPQGIGGIFKKDSEEEGTSL